MDKTIISSLNQANQDFINQQVASGKYPSEQAVVDEALNAMKKQQQRQEKIKHLRKLIDQGERSVAKGDVYELTDELIENITREAKRKMALGLPIKDEVQP